MPGSKNSKLVNQAQANGSELDGTELARLVQERENREKHEHRAGAVDLLTKMQNSKSASIEHDHEAFGRALRYWCKLVNQTYTDIIDSEPDEASRKSS